MRRSHTFFTCLAAGFLAGSAIAQNTSGTFWGTETAEAQQLSQQYAGKVGTQGQAAQAMVAACHDRSVAIGLDILRKGGSAADAFIAITFADYVQTPGASSPAGPLGVLIYDAGTHKLDSLTAPLKTVQDAAAQYHVGDTAVGRQVLVPGAVAGLEALHGKYGRLPWRDLVMPAVGLARDGFTVDYMYAAILSGFQATVKHSGYGRATYFHSDGTPLTHGDTLKLPALADTLQDVADQGADYMYKGAWAHDFVAAVKEEGGGASLDDLSVYRPEWTTPLRTIYRGHDIYALNGHNSGGERLLLALETLGHADVQKLGHYAQSADGLETMIRISRAVNTVTPLAAQTFYDDPAAGQALLDGPQSDGLWQDVTARIDRTPLPPEGSHSYSVVVADSDGNVVSGTHTIESLPFGTGIFVGGVPLNNTATLHPAIDGQAYTTPPGSYIIEPLSASMAFRDGQFELAASTFSASLWPADFELTVSRLDFGWSPEQIALTPRFGGYGLDLIKMTADLSVTQIDKRFSAATVAEMKARGLALTQAGYIDTGMLVMIVRDPATGVLTGFTPEQLLEGRAAGY